MTAMGKIGVGVAMALIVLAGCTPPGMRLLRMEVYHSDRLVLRTTFDAPDREAPSNFWLRAGAQPFASDEQIAAVQANADNPLRASLTGPVRLRILHVDTVMTSTVLTNLDLVRDTPESLKWYLPKDEVQRVRQAAGF